jgi:solute carrier family 25 protein 38
MSQPPRPLGAEPAEPGPRRAATSTSPSSAFHFVAGLCSGMLSAVLLQPADLLKTRVQESRRSSLRTSVRAVLAGPGALRSLWRGTVPSALRTGLGAALYFTSLDALRRGLAGAPVVAAARSSSSLPRLGNVANLASGAVARAAAGFALMPMTVVKVRFESAAYGYTSMAAAGRAIYRHEGLRGFFSGAGATAVRDAPYAGLYVLLYEQMKKRLSRLANSLASDTAIAGGKSAGVNFVSGATAAGLATALTNPFDVIKTRLQLHPKQYRNMAYAARKLLVEDGRRAFLDGLALRMGRKTLSSALAWTVYEELLRRAEPSWNCSVEVRVVD